MVDRPILFSAPMVRAILAGQKTQTRRALRRQFALGALPVEMPKTTPEGWVVNGHSGVWWCDAEANPEEAVRCPYGMPGDRLWVRESHWFFQDECDPVTGYTPPVMTVDDVEYRADGESTRHGWRPSIHMPRWASRITLVITGVRVERLQAIREADAMAEGAEPTLVPPDGGSWPHVEGFETLWKSINGAESWDANPWVWVVEFERSAS